MSKKKMNEFCVLPGFVCIFHSVNKQPLAMWDKKIRSGCIKKVRDEDLCAQVLELNAPKITSTYITCPANPYKVLSIKNPILNLTVKNLNKYFAFEVQILDDKAVKRRFKVSTHQNFAEVKPFYARLPLTLEEGWNQITFPLQEFTMRCYGTNFTEVLRVQVCASCRLRRIYFSNLVCQEQDLPHEFRLNHLAIPRKTNPNLVTEKT